MKRLALALFLAVLSQGAQAQFQANQVLTAAQLNAALAAKANKAGDTFTGPVTLPSLALMGCTGYGYGNAASPVTCAPTIPATSISGLSSSATTDATNAANITSGTLPASRLPVPSASTLGGVQAATAVTNNFMTGLSVLGVPTFAQPAFSNLSGLLPASQMATGAAAANLGFTPANLAGDTFTGAVTIPTLTVSGCSGYAFGNASSQVTCAPTIPGSALASGAAVANLGFTPANRAGDSFTGPVNLSTGNAYQINGTGFLGFTGNHVLLGSSGANNIQRVDTTDSSVGDTFVGLGKFSVQTGPNWNAITGSVIQDGSNGASSQPSGVTGYGAVRSASHAAFGLFGRADCYTTGVCTNEVNSFNMNASLGAGTFPPDRSATTTQTVPVALTVAAGGNYPSLIGVQIAKEGGSPQQFYSGIYMNPDAPFYNGLFIDATSTLSPIQSVLLKNAAQTSAYNALAMQVTNASPAAGSMFINALNSDGTSIFNVSTAGAVNGTGYQINGKPILPLNVVTDCGAVGNNSTDDATAFQNCINAAQTQLRKLYIPRGSYALGSQLSVTVPIDIDSDPQANLRFTNSSASGWLFDFRSNPHALVEINLPGVYGTAFDSTFSIPGYGPSTYTYSLSSRVGSGVYYKGGNRSKIRARYIAGFSDCVKIEATNDGTYGVHGIANLDIEIGTMDFCVAGFSFAAGPAGSAGIYAVSAKANTVWSKYPIFADVANATMGASTIEIAGQAFTNETGGAGFYSSGNNFTTNKVVINWLYAGHGADSTTGVSSSLTLPFLAGSATSNGDGGYFAGFYNEITIGPAVGISPGGDLPAAGKVIRILDSGVNNKITTRYAEQSVGSPIALSGTIGEANYNGGVGGASVSKRTLVSAAVPTLASGGATVFYFYNQLLSAGYAKGVRVLPLDDGMAASGLSWGGMDRAGPGAHNRESYVAFYNKTAASITGATYFFWIEVPE